MHEQCLFAGVQMGAICVCTYADRTCSSVLQNTRCWGSQVLQDFFWKYWPTRHLAIIHQNLTVRGHKAVSNDAHGARVSTGRHEKGLGAKQTCSQLAGAQNSTDIQQSLSSKCHRLQNQELSCFRVCNQNQTRSIRICTVYAYWDYVAKQWKLQDPICSH